MLYGSACVPPCFDNLIKILLRESDDRRDRGDRGVRQGQYQRVPFVTPLSLGGERCQREYRGLPPHSTPWRNLSSPASFPASPPRCRLALGLGCTLPEQLFTAFTVAAAFPVAAAFTAAAFTAAAFTVTVFTVTVFAVAVFTIATLAGISHQRYNRTLTAATQCVVEAVLEG